MTNHKAGILDDNIEFFIYFLFFKIFISFIKSVVFTWRYTKKYARQ